MGKYREFTKAEKKWIERLQRVMNKAPENLFMFIGGGMIIYTKEKNNERYMNEAGSVDQNAPSRGILTHMDMDGGDY